jgi:hypothetical protein
MHEIQGAIPAGRSRRRQALKSRLESTRATEFDMRSLRTLTVRHCGPNIARFAIGRAAADPPDAVFRTHGRRVDTHRDFICLTPFVRRLEWRKPGRLTISSNRPQV